jgi:hypothetical protein
VTDLTEEVVTVDCIQQGLKITIEMELRMGVRNYRVRAAWELTELGTVSSVASLGWKDSTT